ncbi:MAG: CcmD family protein [Candidatus Acidiferrales bacterium]
MKNLNSVFAAFMAVWAVFFVYQITIGRRMARLQDEIERLKNRLK